MFENIRHDFKVHHHSSSYLGFLALLNYRFGVWALNLEVFAFRWFFSKLYVIGLIITESLTGIHLGRDTTIGKGLHFVHGGPININDQAILGDRVGIMQGVTIGTNTTDDVPTIGNDVFIGANASVLGGITIGDGARISANSLVISDVPAGYFAIGVPAKVLPQMAINIPSNKSTPQTDPPPTPEKA